jgi:hypothetical protein
MQRTRPHRRALSDLSGPPAEPTLAQRLAALARRFISLVWGDGQISPVGAILGLLMLGLLALLATSIYQIAIMPILHRH